MMQRMKGTLRPGRKAGVLALAVLLLTCVLMAGAVSANEIQFDESSFSTETGIFTISEDGTYVLNGMATGNITIDVKVGEGNVTLTAKEGATLNGGIQITKAQNVTIKDMHIKSTLISDGRNLAIILPEAPIKLCLMNNTIDFAASDAAKARSSVISTQKSLSDGSAIINNTIFNVTAHVLNTAGVEAGGTLTVQGNTVTMKPNEEIGPGEEGNVQGKGRALLKLFHPYDLTSGVTYIVADNVVEIQQGYPDATVVRVDETTRNPGMITVTMYNNKYNGDSDSPYLYGGSIYGYRLGGLSITVSDADGPRILVPGLNQTGVVWSGGADAAHQELELNKSGSYKLMDGFTTTGSGVNITAGGVTLDGNDKEITTAGKLDGYILKVAVENTGDAKGVTLQNLDITGNVASGTGEYGGITVFAGKNKASVPVILKDSIVDMSKVEMTGGSMNPAVYFVNASGSEITGNTITAGYTDSSSTRCVVVDGGSDVTISSGNTLNLGTAGNDAVSIGVQIKGPNPKNVAVTGNTITAPDDSATKSIAVDITTTGKGESHSITGNIISAAEGSGKFDSAVRVLLSSAIPDEEGSLDITVSGNTVTNAQKGVYIMAGSEGARDRQLTLTGTINEDDFQGLSRADILAADLELPNQPITDSVVWTHDPEPSYSSGGNMNNAYRVLFNDGATTLSVQTDLSSGDKLTKPETPVKDGYTFAGWYKDSACTQAWDFETGIPGDMTLYAKWTAAGSSGETEATATPTATATAVTTPQPTKTQTAAATTSAPQATTAAGVSPTLTQAPAPVAGALFGLLAAGVLLRRRFQ